MISRPTMTVVVDGKEVQREVDHIECCDHGVAGALRGHDRRVPRTHDDEMVFETIGGPPVVIRTGIE